MNKTAYLASVIVATTLSLTATAQDAARGKAAYAQCMACHTVDGGTGLGPTLKGVVGRTSGTLAGFKYSPPMKRSAIPWDDANLDAFLADPQTKIPGNAMPFAGVPDAAARADLISYLKTLK